MFSRLYNQDAFNLTMFGTNYKQIILIFIYTCSIAVDIIYPYVVGDIIINTVGI